MTMKTKVAAALFGVALVGASFLGIEHFFPRAAPHRLAAFPSFPATGGGGLSTVTTAAPASGDGSSGNPVTVRAATASLSGYLSAADKAKVDSLANGGWFDTEKAWLQTVCPWATEFSAIKIGQVPIGRAATATNDGLVEGGGLSPSASPVSFGDSVFQLPKTGRVCLEYRVKFVVPISSHISEVGINNNAASHSVWFGGLPSGSGGDATHYSFVITGASSTIAASTTLIDATAFHNDAMTFDGTTYTLWHDHVAILTQTTLTNLTDEAMGPFQYSATAGDSIATKLIYGYVAP